MTDTPYDAEPVSEAVGAALAVKAAEERTARNRRMTQIGIGAGIGIGSAALVAALLYGNQRKPRDK